MSDSKHHTYGEFDCPWPGCTRTSTTRQGLGKHFKPTHGTTLRDYERRHNDGEFPCPTCDNVFDTDRGVKVHHKRAHGDSIAGVVVDCDHCGDAVTIVPDRLTRYEHHYCDDSCRLSDDQNRVVVDCAWCGDGIELDRWYADITERSFCRDKPCRSEWMSANLLGPTSPRWLGGAAPYGDGWNEAKKEQVRERDGRVCQNPGCGRTEAEHIEKFGSKHTVHHIQKARWFDDPEKRNHEDNLITLCCGSCHHLWERMSPLRPDTTHSLDAD